MEPVTRAVFLTALPDDSGVLAGAGVRAMTPLRVKVYALGLYGERRALVAACRPAVAAAAAAGGGAAAAAPVSPAALLDTPAVWARLCAPRGSASTLRLVVAREVTGDHMLHGFERALKPRLKAAAKKPHGYGDAKPGLAAFTKWWKTVGTLKVGTELTVSRDGAGRVTMAIKGEPLGTVESDALAWALWDMFLGPKGVSAEIRQGVADGLAALTQGADHVAVLRAAVGEGVDALWAAPGPAGVFCCAWAAEMHRPVERRVAWDGLWRGRVAAVKAERWRLPCRRSRAVALGKWWRAGTTSSPRKVQTDSAHPSRSTFLETSQSYCIAPCGLVVGHCRRRRAGGRHWNAKNVEQPVSTALHSSRAEFCLLGVTRCRRDPTGGAIEDLAVDTGLLQREPIRPAPCILTPIDKATCPLPACVVQTSPHRPLRRPHCTLRRLYRPLRRPHR